MQQYEIVIYTSWVIYSGYCSIGAAVVFGMGITCAKLLFCCGISDNNRYKVISIRDYNYRTVFQLFNNNFPDNCGTSALNIFHMVIVDSPPPPSQIYHNTSDKLPSTISVAYKNDFSTLTSPSGSLTIHFPVSDDPIMEHNKRMEKNTVRHDE